MAFLITSKVNRVAVLLVFHLGSYFFHFSTFFNQNLLDIPPWRFVSVYSVHRSVVALPSNARDLHSPSPLLSPLSYLLLCCHLLPLLGPPLHLSPLHLPRHCSSSSPPCEPCAWHGPCRSGWAWTQTQSATPERNSKMKLANQSC